MHSPADVLPQLSFGRMAPTLHVSDLARAIAFYQHDIGLELAFQNGHPPIFAILKRGATELHLSVSPHPIPATDQVRAHLLVSDAQALHDHLTRRGVRIVKPMKDVTPTMRGFVFSDVDGNCIDVGQSTV